MSIIDKIYQAYTDREAAMPPQKHVIGASGLGHECDRKLWLTLRQCVPSAKDGRLLRLFQYGHDAEPRIAQELQDAGLDLVLLDSDGKQFRATACNGHVSANVDGIISGQFIWECKTHNDKSFKALVKNGVKELKPLHYVQCQVAMGLFNFKSTLYIAENKNTSELHEETIEFNPDDFVSYMIRAEHIIESAEPPPKCCEDREFFTCKYCDCRGLCYDSDIPAATCFTCINSTPVEDGQWHCSKAASNVPDDVLFKGCPEHLYIPSLLVWEVLDADDGWVLYQAGQSTICNVTAQGFPPVSGDDAPALFTSAELATLGNAGAMVDAVAKSKQAFGGKVVGVEKP